MRVLVFPGQGVQRKGMGEELFEDAKDVVDEMDEVLGYSIVELCRDDPGGRLRETRYAQPAIFAVNALAARRGMADEPGRYGYLAGHSLGEYNALVAAGVLDLAAGLRLVVARAEAMAEVTGGGMAAVTGLPANLVRSTLRGAGLDRVHLANHNSDRQVTIAGPREDLRTAVRVLREAGAKRVTPVPVSGPFHTPLMEPAGRAFAGVVAGCAFATGHTPVMSSVTGEPFRVDAAADLLVRQIAAPVQWVATVRALRAAGADAFEEVNGNTLTTLIDQVG